MDQAEQTRVFGAKDYDMLIYAAVFQEPEPTVGNIFGSGSALNLSGIDDPALNEALLAGRTAASTQERKAAYDRLQQRLAELTPVIFLTRAAPSVVAHKNVGGITLYGMGSPLAEELWLQK